MSAIDELLASFENHYSTREYQLRYTDFQRSELQDKYYWMSGVYAVHVYDEVIGRHGMSLRSLPDMAVINKAIVSMNPPASYEKPKLLDAPIDYDDESDREAWLRLLEKIGVKMPNKKL